VRYSHNIDLPLLPQLSATPWKAHSVLVSDENLLSTPESEFLELLLRGIASIPLEQFLGHKLKLSGAKMLNRLFDAAFETLESLLPDHLLQAAATVQHRVSGSVSKAFY
jgi:hypothetical protein